MMIRLQRVFLMTLMTALAMSMGCMTKRSTTTVRTAVEQALITQSAELAIDQLDLSLFSDTFEIVAEGVEAIDKEYLLGYLNRNLVKAGATPVTIPEEPAIRIYPSIATGAIDDTSFLLGIPEFPVSLPGLGAITIPEAAIFKSEKQKGRHRLFLRGHRLEGEPKDFVTEIVASQKYYDRWTIMFVINFRTTNLEKPF